MDDINIETDQTLDGGAFEWALFDGHCVRFSRQQPRPMGPGVAGGPTAAAVVAASEGKAKKYGLLGLLGVIRMTDPDLNTLALGSDLTTVGLNLDSAEVRE